MANNNKRQRASKIVGKCFRGYELDGITFKFPIENDVNIENACCSSSMTNKVDRLIPKAEFESRVVKELEARFLQFQNQKTKFQIPQKTHSVCSSVREEAT
jgi:hypothetical protein